MEVVQRDASGASRGPGRAGSVIQRLDALGVAVRPTLFAYQFLYELQPAAEPVGTVARSADAESGGRGAPAEAARSA